MATNTNEATLSYFTLIGKCEEAEDTSYERKTDDGKPETIQKVQLSLVDPRHAGSGARGIRPGGGPHHRPDEPVGARGELAGGQRLGDAHDHLQAPECAGGRGGGGRLRRLRRHQRPRGHPGRAQAAAGGAQGAEDQGQAAPCRSRRREGRQEGRRGGSQSHPAGSVSNRQHTR